MIFFLGDDRPFFGKFAIDFNPSHQIWRLRRDGFSWAFRHANSAIDATVRIDHKHVFTFVKTIDRTDRNAVGIFTFYAIIGDDVGHIFLKKFRFAREAKKEKRSKKNKLRTLKAKALTSRSQWRRPRFA